MSIQVFILSQLMEGSTYPYKLKKDLLESIPLDQLGNITESKLYYHFESLAKQGFIEVVEIIKDDNRPDKQVYAITEKGKQALPQKIYEICEKATSFAELLVPTIFIQHVDIEKVIIILQNKLLKYQQKFERLQALRIVTKEKRSKVVGMEVFDYFIQQKFEQEIQSLQSLIEQFKNELRANS